ncbi:TROVE domain-containing protein [Chitinimonas lacunae]|uniref:TROVE domain-containing protein n=1 Tax=Chitinimonas lacunae TaxID=1963018 RepID=A0ABV8MS38_9NEIS
MANPHLFNSRQKAVTNTRNASGAPAYQRGPKQQLAQYAMTGCLNSTFYVNAQTQLEQVLKLCATLDPEFIAKTAIYCRERGHMKDMAALLTAVLAAKRSDWLAPVFERVIDNGKMLRTWVQILRSGATGRRSLGTRPKRLVQGWLNQANEQQLLQAAVGNQPSLADVVKMVHPKPAEPWREAFFAWQLGRPVERSALPAATQALLAFRERHEELPNVPFLLLSNETLSAAQWGELAERMGWQALRMNLNTLARNGAFKIKGVAQTVACRLADPDLIRRSRVLPYQLLSAFKMAGDEVPAVVREALQDALDLALANVPALSGRVVVCPDVSGSMASPVTGQRQGGTSSVRCIDVAALVAAALLRTNPATRVLPFEHKVVDLTLNRRDSVMTNAQKLAAIGGGGTSCSAPLAWLNQQSEPVDLVIFVSDNESWIDQRYHNRTATMAQWEILKRRNPQARLVCIDLQPGASTQAADQDDILNIGGFGDSVFEMVAEFANGGFGAEHWVRAIEAVELTQMAKAA